MTLLQDKNNQHQRRVFHPNDNRTVILNTQQEHKLRIKCVIKNYLFLFYFHHALLDELRIVHLYMMQQNLFVDLDYP